MAFCYKQWWKSWCVRNFGAMSIKWKSTLFYHILWYPGFHCPENANTSTFWAISAEKVVFGAHFGRFPALKPYIPSILGIPLCSFCSPAFCEAGKPSTIKIYHNLPRQYFFKYKPSKAQKWVDFSWVTQLGGLHSPIICPNLKSMDGFGVLKYVEIKPQSGRADLFYASTSVTGVLEATVHHPYWNEAWN